MKRVWTTLLCLIVAVASCPVLAAPPEDAKSLSAKGVALFKKNDFLGAAQALEKAYAADPREFRVLRSAGRAWQEIGHWDRALTLFERYLSLEPEAAVRESLQPNVDKLRKATPQERAEALEHATQKYPQARLEDEAGKAFEALGDLASLKKAVQLWEVARLGATDPAEKARLDKDIQRLRDKVRELEARPAVAPQPVLATPTVQTQAPRPGPTTLQWALWGGGTALVAAGAVLWLQAASATQAANDQYQEHDLTYADYKRKRSDTDVRYFTGIGLVGAGVLAAGAGFLLGPDRAKVAVTPGGVSLALRF